MSPVKSVESYSFQWGTHWNKSLTKNKYVIGLGISAKSFPHPNNLKKFSYPKPVEFVLLKVVWGNNILFAFAFFSICLQLGEESKGYCT